ncbi:hypothetical protein RMATCC62417_09336 [Rhizopus microsporus]|nr:hypothetical protein RMATCC62417_09336 [Rhizopus microsporus]
MQIKLVILTICASLATIGFAAPPPLVYKPADASKGAVGPAPKSIADILRGIIGGRTNGGTLGGLTPGLP